MTHDFKVGDIVTGYHKGYHKILSFREIGPPPTLQVIYAKLDLKTGKFKRKNACAVSYCKHAAQAFREEQSHLQRLKELLLENGVEGIK